MKFGLFYELSVPRPWTRESERTVYNNALEQVKLADELGFDQVWAVEHHFLEEYSHCSAPELFLTACAMLTKNIRVGHGIVVCVPEFNHPIKIAEKTAVLDILSGGRLEVGTGRSATWTELGGFHANPDDTKKSWDEFVRCLPKMWTLEHVRVPGRVLVDAGADHPAEGLPAAAPADVGGGDEPGHRAGRRRPRPRQPRAHLRPVRRAGEEDRRVPPPHPALHARRRVRQRPGLHGELPLLPRGRQGGAASAAGRWPTRSTTWRPSSPRCARSSPGRSYPSLGLLPQLRRQATGPEASEQAGEGLCLGGPERIIRALKRWEAVGVDRVNFLLNANEVIPQAEVLDSLRLFAREVMPAFATSKPATAGDR